MLEGKRQFLISANEATAVDILYYNELSIALFLLRLKGFKKNYPHVNAWIKLMSEIEELMFYEEKMAECVEKY